MAGYSGTPLPQKLGIKPGARLGVVRQPPDFAKTLGELPPGVVARPVTAAGTTPFDVIVCFVRTNAELARELPRMRKRLDAAGGLWIAWPKKASGVPTDVTENHVRALALQGDLVDNKVCAIDDVWSGLRLVVRLKNRPKPDRQDQKSAQMKRAAR